MRAALVGPDEERGVSPRGRLTARCSTAGRGRQRSTRDRTGRRRRHHRVERRRRTAVRLDAAPRRIGDAVAPLIPRAQPRTPRSGRAGLVARRTRRVHTRAITALHRDGHEFRAMSTISITSAPARTRIVARVRDRATPTSPRWPTRPRRPCVPGDPRSDRRRVRRRRSARELPLRQRRLLPAVRPSSDSADSRHAASGSNSQPAERVAQAARGLHAGLPDRPAGQGVRVRRSGRRRRDVRSSSRSRSSATRRAGRSAS